MLVSSLMDLEAEEGKISHYKPTVGAVLREGTTPAGSAPQISLSKARSTLVHPRLLPAPGRGGFLLAQGGLWGHPGRLHPWDSW